MPGYNAGISSANLGLTSTYVCYASTSGGITGASTFTYDGTYLAVGGSAVANGRMTIVGGTADNMIEMVPSSSTQYSGFELRHTDATTVGVGFGYQQSTTHFRINVVQAGSYGMLLGASSEKFRWNSTGVGFHASTPVAKQTVTGSRGGNAALASVLTALASYGLITDSSSA